MNKDSFKNLVSREVIILTPHVDLFRSDSFSGLNGELPKYVEWVAKSFYAIDKKVTFDDVYSFLRDFDAYLTSTIFNRFSDNVVLNEADMVALLINYAFEKGMSDLAHSLMLIRFYTHPRGRKRNVLPRVKRRNGQVVPFMQYKIEKALSLSSIDYDEKILDSIVERILHYPHDIISLDVLQDFIVGVLLEQGHDDYARLYAKYRANNIVARLEDLYKHKFTTDKLVIKESDGTDYYFTKKELNKIIKFCSQGLRFSISDEEIASRLMKSTYDGIARTDFYKTLLLNAKSLMELDYRFGYFAGRLLLLDIYEKNYWI